MSTRDRRTTGRSSPRRSAFRALRLALPGLLFVVLELAAGRAGAAPVADPALRQAIRRSVARIARAGRGAPSGLVRGRVQEALLQQLKAHRTREEWKAMRASGLPVSYRDARELVEREFEVFVRGFERPAGWEELTPGRQFGALYKALAADFVEARTFPSNWQALDQAGRLETLRCLAGSCGLREGPKELARWLELTGTPVPAAARPLTKTEQMVRLSAGGARPPKKRYYGPETAKALENFRITGQRVPLDMIRSVAEVKAAAAMTNMRTGRLDRTIGTAIVTAAQEVIAGRHDDQFFTDPIQGGAGTSVNMNVNEVIAARASELVSGRIGDSSVVHPNDHVNMAQSTNDVYPTAARLTAYRRLQSLVSAYELLVAELTTQAGRYANLPKPGRTHLEDAVPIMLGREFKAYAAVLKRDVRYIKEAMRALTSVNLGGTAVGTTLNAEPAYVRNVTKTLAGLTGVPLVRSRDLVDATQNVDSLTRAHAMLKVSASSLIKICNDLRLMNSGPRAGFGELQLPEQQKGSSIMPGKVNPVIAEVMNQIGYQVQGNDVVVNLAAQNGQFELNQMEPVLVHNLLGSVQIMDRGIRALAEKAIRGLKVNDEACLRGARQMLGLATALVPRLGYDRAAYHAKTALRTNRSLLEVVVESGDLPEAEAAKLLSPARMARGGMLD